MAKGRKDRRSEPEKNEARVPVLEYRARDDVGAAWIGALRSRGCFIICALAIVMGVIAMYAQERWLAVVMLMLTDGLLVALWVGSAALLGWRAIKWVTGIRSDGKEDPAVSRERGGRLKGNWALVFATSAGLGLGIFSLAALGLGLAGALNRWTVIAILLAGPGMAVRRVVEFAKAGKQVPVLAWLGKPLGGQWLLLAAGPALGMMTMGASIMPGVLWKPEDPHPYDALEYHLQVPREWYELGRIVELRHNVFSYFPYGAEMQSLVAMHLRGGAWEAMYQCQFFSMAWVALMGLAVYGAVRGAVEDETRRRIAGAAGMEVETPSKIVDEVVKDRSRGRILASAATVMAVTLPWMIMLGSVAYTESALACYTALAVGWCLRGLRDERGRMRTMALAGLMAGLACGAKYTAIPMVLGGLAISIGIIALATRRLLQWWKPLGLFILLAGAVVSPWLIRNALWTGNPVFPLAMKQLGRGHFDEVQVERFRIAHSVPHDKGDSENGFNIEHRLRSAREEILTHWQYGYLFWPTIALAFVLSPDRHERWLILCQLIFVLIVWIGFTHLLGRFYVLCIPVAAMAIGLARWKPWPAIAAGLAILSAILSWWPISSSSAPGPSGFSMMHARMEHFAELGRQGLFGLDDLSYLVPENLKKMDQPGETVSLMGDAQGFLYSIPSARLRYRTVFDLPGDAPDMYRAWLGVPKEKAQGLIVINPMEIERLSKTYYRVPGVAADYEGPRDRPEVIRK